MVLSTIAVVIILGLIGLIPVMVMHTILKVKARKNFDRLLKEVCLKQKEERKEAWKQQVEINKHLLAGDTWKDPYGKANFVFALYGKVPNYLWYSLGTNMDVVNADLTQRINHIFFDDKASFGDMELYLSEYPEVGLLVRIRSPLVFKQEIQYDGNIFPLYQVGRAGIFSQVGCVNFFELQAFQLAE